mmetsp:Transcript_25011/g.99412  ORF Transcript_25011/g.99412 Transcript_25011/m.99412 type:complete len:211 (+) Transcript_25011:1296-1928(+)
MPRRAGRARLDRRGAAVDQEALQGVVHRLVGLHGRHGGLDHAARPQRRQRHRALHRLDQDERRVERRAQVARLRREHHPQDRLGARDDPVDHQDHPQGDPGHQLPAQSGRPRRLAAHLAPSLQTSQERLQGVLLQGPTRQERRHLDPLRQTPRRRHRARREPSRRRRRRWGVWVLLILWGDQDRAIDRTQGMLSHTAEAPRRYSCGVLFP